MKSMRAVWVSLAMTVATTAAAQAVKVEAVQYPAWLDRGGQTVPLSPGIELHASDKLRTGNNARVRLRLGEGSTVKLGENAQFVVERVQHRNVFSAALAVLAGAFRFTSEAVARARKRDITIRARTITAGIRGTDLWGKATDERDLVCLIDGRISVTPDEGPAVTLDQPLDFYQRPRGGKGEVAKIDQKQLDIWSLETEMSKDGAAADAAGTWKVVVLAAASRDEALAANRSLRAAGYPARISASGAQFRVEVTGLAGEAQAAALASALRGLPGVREPVAQQGR